MATDHARPGDDAPPTPTTAATGTPTAASPAGPSRSTVRRLAPLLLVLGAVGLLVVMAVASPFETTDPDIEVRQAFVGAGSDPAGAYLVIVDHGGTDDLTGVTTPVGEVTLQRRTTDATTGEQTLQTVDSLRIEGFDETRLQPGGDQLLIELEDPDGLRAGTTVPLRLEFRVSEDIEVQAEVRTYDEIGQILLPPVLAVPEEG
jgi:copper(I)-binding protein